LQPGHNPFNKSLLPLDGGYKLRVIGQPDQPFGLHEFETPLCWGPRAPDKPHRIDILIGNDDTGQQTDEPRPIGRMNLPVPMGIVKHIFDYSLDRGVYSAVGYGYFDPIKKGSELLLSP